VKNNKGFTLVEIIVTIGLLLLIATVTVPSIITIQNKNKNKNYENLKETIITAAENYYQNNLDLGSSDKCHITLQDLANKNLIKTPIKNPKTNKEISLSTYIEIKKIINVNNNVEIIYRMLEETPEVSIKCPIKQIDISINITPNKPVLVEGLIPIVYDETNKVWVKADENGYWYDYDSQKWANAVTVTNTNRDTYMSAEVGTPISMDDINTMWVWIPRFKYRIPYNFGTDSNVKYPPEIYISFEKGTSTTGVSESKYRQGLVLDTINVNYYTHPAFRDVDNIEYDTSITSRGGWDEEITGFWVGKFETGGTDTTPLIKPNISSLRNQSLSAQFLASLKFAGGEIDSNGVVTFSGNDIYGLTSTSDTHMMKNTEWGAIAYLSHSYYGKYGNKIYNDENKYVYKNSSTSYTTGYGYNCEYNNINDRLDGSGACGAGASTTGNIYGVYDMNGGTSEYVMANYYKYSGYRKYYHSNFNGKCYSTCYFSSPVAFPVSKYFDYYTGTNEVKDDIILGDATWEIRRWYNETFSMIYASNPWFYRESVFSTREDDGSADNYTWRATLIP